MSIRVACLFVTTVLATLSVSCGGDGKGPSICGTADCTSYCVEICGQGGVISMSCTNDGCACECRARD